MNNQLTESQAARVVAEVSKLAQLRELDERERLDAKQVVQILEELKLPVELLDPAMRELERVEAEAQVRARYGEAVTAERRQRFRIVGSIVAALLIMILSIGVYVQHRNRLFAGIAVAEGAGRLTRASDDGGNLGSVTRDGSSELYYRVALERVPLAKNLSLKCNWIDPSGRVIKQNSWDTRATDRTVWTTACRCALGATAPPGTWRVEMLLGDRLLSQTNFQVE